MPMKHASLSHVSLLISSEAALKPLFLLPCYDFFFEQFALKGRAKDCDEIGRSLFVLIVLNANKQIIFALDPIAEVQIPFSCSAAHHSDRLSLQVTLMKVSKCFSFMYVSCDQSQFLHFSRLAELMETEPNSAPFGFF